MFSNLFSYYSGFVDDLKLLIEWCDEKGIKIVVDESFADFADEKDNSLILQEVLVRYPHLYAMKSISKSYGIPGLRLGVLASGDTEIIKRVKKDVSIWNINSFAEFYMQIAEKYKKYYNKALELFKKERNNFLDKLVKKEGIRVVPSQANYFMIEVLDDKRVSEITKRLLVDHNILVKDLSAKLNGREYMRLAIRGDEDNDIFVQALTEVLNNNTPNI